MIASIKQRRSSFSANMNQNQKLCGRGCYRLSHYGEGLP